MQSKMQSKMKLTKQYLRFVPGGNVNIITSDTCNAVFVTLEGQQGRFVAVGACEHVFIWDLRLSEKAQVLTGDKFEVTQLAASPDNRHIACGYSDGTIKTFDLRSGEIVTVFSGHRAAITTLAYDALGHHLASGSQDTDIIVWDVVQEKGKCRLDNHKGVITKVAFMQDSNILISSSKDTLVKFWDLDTEHNFRTIVGHRSEVWSFTLVKDDKYLITGCADSELRVWKIYFADSENDELSRHTELLNIDNDDSVNDPNYPLRCEKVGSIYRTQNDRLHSLVCDPTKRIIACHGTKKTIEIFHLVSDEQVLERLSNRLMKAEKKTLKEGKSIDMLDPSTALKDEIIRLKVFNVTSNVKTIDLILGKNDEIRFCVGLNNNSLELYSLNLNETNKDKEISALRSITLHGHRTEVRALCFSSDNLAFASASGDSIKLWNRQSLACIRTVECGYALTATFVPGDRHLIVGMRDGKMLIVDINSGDILEQIPAHSAQLRSVILLPNLKGVASGGGDKTVKFWNFELVEDTNSDTKCRVLSVLHSRTLKLDESVLCVRISVDNRLIAVSLLNSTVSIFFMDSYKFLVSLYGHNQPVLVMDISDDSSLIATGSADRNIKIWGMNKGDCHKSIFAHDDTITGLSFVPKTHYFFSCGKDGKVKQWDADNFQKIVTLDGHKGEAYACSISPNGVFLISAGADRVIRLYEKSSEILVLEDEAEEEREKQDNELATGDTTAVPGQKQQVLPSKKTVDAEKAADLILECLEVSKIYNEELSNSLPPAAPPALPLIMRAFGCDTTEDYLIETLKKIRVGEMEETLYLLPYASACEILQMLPKLLKNEYQAEMLSRVALSLIQAHHGPIIANPDLFPVIQEIKNLAVKNVTSLRVIHINYNIIHYQFYFTGCLINIFYFPLFQEYNWLQSSWVGVHTAYHGGK